VGNFQKAIAALIRCIEILNF